MKNLIITGSSGKIATQLIDDLVKENFYTIYAVTTKPNLLKDKYKNKKNVICISIDDIVKILQDVDVFAVVHCAFSRNSSGTGIATSLEYLRKIIDITKLLKLKYFFNLSSQSVYGETEKPLWTEKTIVNPSYPYAVGKFASEQMVILGFKGSFVKYSNIRLASVSENRRFLGIFVKNALEGKAIKVIGGKQSISFIDVRDVSNALNCILHNCENIDLKELYNLGTGKCRTILELAYDVKKNMLKYLNKQVFVEVEDSDIKLDVGVDNTLFCSDFNWNPKYDYDDMILYLIQNTLKNS